MDISLDQAIEVREKTQDELVEDEAHSDILNENEEDPAGMREGAGTGPTGSGLHYQFRNAENGQVTYRVVQVGGDENNQQATLSIVTTNGILNQLSQDENNGGSGPQVAIVGNPFSSDSGNEGTTSTGTATSNQRFTYFQGSSGGSTDLPSPTSTGSASAGQNEQQLLQGSQFYVMMSPQEMLQSGANTSTRTIIGRTSFPHRGEDGGRNPRDDTRRVQHNEVERRRRDKINTWILKLATMIPDCANDHTKQGQSKGGILAKACDYILDLQHANAQLTENLKEFEQMQINYELCQQQLEEAKQKVQLLTQTLQSNGIEVAITTQAQQ